MKSELKIQITNVTAYLGVEGRIDLWETSKANPDVEFDGFSKYAYFPTSTGKGRIMLFTRGISIMGAKCETDAIDELRKVINGRIKIVFAMSEDKASAKKKLLVRN